MQKSSRVRLKYDGIYLESEECPLVHKMKGNFQLFAENSRNRKR